MNKIRNGVEHTVKTQEPTLITGLMSIITTGILGRGVSVAGTEVARRTHMTTDLCLFTCHPSPTATKLCGPQKLKWGAFPLVIYSVWDLNSQPYTC